MYAYRQAVKQQICLFSRCISSKYAHHRRHFPIYRRDSP